MNQLTNVNISPLMGHIRVPLHVPNGILIWQCIDPQLSLLWKISEHKDPLGDPLVTSVWAYVDLRHTYSY